MQATIKTYVREQNTSASADSIMFDIFLIAQSNCIKIQINHFNTNGTRREVLYLIMKLDIFIADGQPVKHVIARSQTSRYEWLTSNTFVSSLTNDGFECKL